MLAIALLIAPLLATTVEKYQCGIHPWMRMEVHVGKH
jgi:hypothetical protein